MKLLLLILSLGAAPLAFAADDCPLTGSWQSDKEKTMPGLTANQRLSLSDKAKVAELIGEMVVTYADCSTATVGMGDKTQTFKFEVTQREGNTLTIRDSKTGMDQQLTLEGDCYHTPFADVGFNEYYCKYDPDAPTPAKAHNHHHH